MLPLMAKLIADLPAHCQIKNRGTYADVYFMPHPKDRVAGWPPTLHIGRTDRMEVKDIASKANQIHDDYTAFKIKSETGIDVRVTKGSLAALISIYKESNYWKKLSDRTKADYNIFLEKINDWSFRARHPHISKLKTKTIYDWLKKEWPDAIRRQKYARTILINLYNVAIREGEAEHNLAEKVILERVTRDEKKKIHIWSQDDIDSFVQECDKRGLYSLGSIVLTGIETAQRQADVVKMRYGVNYQDGKLCYVQQKTGKTVKFNATKKLAERYKKHPSGQMFMFICEKTGKPWVYRTLAEYIRTVRDAVGLTEHVFAHLRHSQVYYLYELGLDKNTIAAITGHSLKTIDSMLDQHYLEVRSERLANQGVAKINRVRQKVRQGGQTK